MGQRAERREHLVVGDPHRIGSVLGQLLLDTRQTDAHSHRFELHAEAVGQFAALGKQFQTHVGNRAVFEFYIYKYIIHLCNFSD